MMCFVSATLRLHGKRLPYCMKLASLLSTCKQNKKVETKICLRRADLETLRDLEINTASFLHVEQSSCHALNKHYLIFA